MKLTQSKINEMSVSELIENIELAVVEAREELAELREEVKPKLVELLSANVEIVEEEDETEYQANIIRSDLANQ